MHICNVHYVQCNVHYVQFAMSALSMSPPLKTQSMHHFPAKKKTSPYMQCAQLHLVQFHFLKI